MLGVMKIIASWILIAIGVLLSASALVMLGVYVYRELRMRFGSHTFSFTDSPSVPDGIGIQFLGFRHSFFSTPWVVLLGQLGIGLVVVAVGLHLRYLHRMDIGRERLQKTEAQIYEQRHNKRIGCKFLR
jgi:hypothetical protein